MRGGAAARGEPAVLVWCGGRAMLVWCGGRATCGAALVRCGGWETKSEENEENAKTKRRNEGETPARKVMCTTLVKRGNRCSIILFNFFYLIF